MQLQRDGARRSSGEGVARPRRPVRKKALPQGVFASAAHVLARAHQVSHEARRRARPEPVGAHLLGRGHRHHHGKMEGLYRPVRRSVHPREHGLVGRALHRLRRKPSGEHPAIHEHGDVRGLGRLPRAAARVRKPCDGYHDGARQRAVRRGHLQRKNGVHVGKQPFRDLHAALALPEGGAGAGCEDHLDRPQRDHRLGARRRMVHGASGIGPGPHALDGAGDHRGRPAGHRLSEARHGGPVPRARRYERVPANERPGRGATEVSERHDQTRR